MTKYALKYGLISGVAVAVFMFLSLLMMKSETIDFGMGQVVGYAVMLLALSLVFVGTKLYRDKEQDGAISFGKAFKLGLYISVVAALVYAIWWMIYYAAGPGEKMMEQYFEANVQSLQGSDLSEAERTAQLEKMEQARDMYDNFIIRFGFTLMEILPVGILVTLISSLILKRKG